MRRTILTRATRSPATRVLATLMAVLATAGVAAAQGADGASASGPLQVAVAHSDTYGDYLVDGDGMALYVAAEPGKIDSINQGDTPPVASCTAACLQVWPPALSEGAPKAGDGVQAEKLSTVKGPSGGNQVSYAGWPLYYFAADTSKGDTFGQDVVPPQGAALGAAWYLIAPDGTVILKAPPKQ